MEALSTISDGRAGVDVYVSIPYASLVFVRSQQGFSATYDLYVTVTQDGTDEPVYQETWTDTVFTTSYEVTQGFERLLREERVPLAAGDYTVEIMLEDASSDASTVRRQTVAVEPPGSERTSLSGILLRTSRDGESTEPVVTMHIPAGYDSLEAVVQLYNVPETAEARFALVRFESDTSTATPPYWFTPSHFTLPYIGIDYEQSDTIQVSRRVVQDAGTEIAIGFDLPPLEKGVYVAQVKLEGAEGDVARRRYFTIQGPSFPRITSLQEMVASLRYIARDDEMDHIRSADSSEEMRRRFDAFWAELEPNRQAAANLLASYYERVEQANILFSNHKEGWKTDRGMIYIIFGPPAYVDNRFTRRDWYYFRSGSLVGRRVPPFVFRRSTAYGLAGLFENFVLQRSELFEDEWRREQQKWRDGEAL